MAAPSVVRRPGSGSHDYGHFNLKPAFRAPKGESFPMIVGIA